MHFGWAEMSFIIEDANLTRHPFAVIKSNYNKKDIFSAK